MDIDKLKSIDIVDFMLKNGYKQGRGRTGKWRSFYSPFGTEANASFKIDTNCNKFLDFSAGVLKKSSIIDLVMMLNKCSFGEACDILSGDEQLEVRHFEPKKQESGVTVHSTSKITNKELLDYACGERKISEDVLHKFCVQIEISFPFGQDPNKTYSLIGFKSDMGGYECRNSWMKVCTMPKSHTTIKGKSNDKCIMVEGFFDALSYFTYYGVLVPEYTLYCLNGAGQFPVLNNFIGDKEVLYYGDSDKNGDLILSNIKNGTDMRTIYPFFKDFNEYICNLY